MFASALQKLGQYLGKKAIEEMVTAFKAWLKLKFTKKKAQDTANNEDRDEATDTLNDIMR